MMAVMSFMPMLLPWWRLGGDVRRDVRHDAEPRRSTREAAEVVRGLSVLGRSIPCDSCVLVDPEADGLVEGQADHVGHDEGVDQHREGAQGLGPELGEAAAVEEAVVHVEAGRAGGAVRCVGEEADEQGADETADEVDADDVEAVVEAEPELQADGEGTAGTGDEADDEGARSARPWHRPG